MKNLIKTMLGAGAVAATLGLAGMGTAHANGYDFTADITAAGMSNGYGATAQLAVGQAVCRELDAGLTPTQVVHDLWLNSQLNLSQSYQFVDISIRDLCSYNSQPWNGYGSTV